VSPDDPESDALGTADCCPGAAPELEGALEADGAAEPPPAHPARSAAVTTATRMTGRFKMDLEVEISGCADRASPDWPR
jgi:hypothetical protein